MDNIVKKAGTLLKILVVEDNKINRMVITKFLEKMGHEPVSSSNGIEALDVLQTQKFDLILMDVEMPDMNGIETTKEIRKNQRASYKDIPIIALTAHTSEADKERFLAAGMNGFTGKPVDKAELAAAIESIKERS